MNDKMYHGLFDREDVMKWRAEMLAWGELTHEGETYHYDADVDFFLDAHGNKYSYATLSDPYQATRLKERGDVVIELVGDDELFAVALMPCEVDDCPSALTATPKCNSVFNAIEVMGPDGLIGHIVDGHWMPRNGIDSLNQGESYTFTVNAEDIHKLYD
jgi:hypothetical protein